MTFKVRVTAAAKQDIRDATAYIARDSRQTAKKWRGILLALIASLNEMPTRYAIIPEADDLAIPYRSALHYSHRVIFLIDEPSNTVIVVRVYHGARKPLAPGDL